MQQILLSELAQVAHLSASYLSTKFKKETGVSFTQYLVNFRMNKAREYLDKGRKNCKEVAEAVGYPDYVQFSKMFKKYYGVAPSAYGKE